MFGFFQKETFHRLRNAYHFATNNYEPPEERIKAAERGLYLITQIRNWPSDYIVPRHRMNAAFYTVRGECTRMLPNPNPEEANERAIQDLERALKLLAGDTENITGAMTHMYLANAYADSASRPKDESIEKAIQYASLGRDFYHGKNGLEHDYAMACANLVTYYSERSIIEKHQNALLGLEDVEQALTIWNRQQNPVDWSRIKVLEGSLLLRVEDKNRSDLVEKSISSIVEGLEILTPSYNTEEWIEAHCSLALAYTERVAGSKAANMEHAVDSLRKSFAAVNEDTPLQRKANVMEMLADMLSRRIKGSRSENLREAVKFATEASTIYQKISLPHQFTIASLRVARLQMDINKIERIDGLELILAVLNDVVHYAKEHGYQALLREAYTLLGEYYMSGPPGNRNDNIEKAIEVFTQHEALCKDRDIHGYHIARMNKATAYMERIIGGKHENVRTATELYQEAHDYFERAGYNDELADVKNFLATALMENNAHEV